MNLIPQGFTGFTDWVSFFSNLATDCPIECEVYQAGCTNNIVPYMSYDQSDNQIYVQTNTNSKLDFTICVKCTTIKGENDAANLDEVKLDNWVITVNRCLESLITPTTDPQVINLMYEPGGSDVQIYPDSSNKTWDDYFFSNSECSFESCTLYFYVGGSCSGAMTTNDHVYASGTNPWQVFAKTSISTGYQISVCIACSELTSYTMYVEWSNWLVNLIAYECQIQSIASSTIFLDINQILTTQLSSLFEIDGPDKAEESCQTLQGSLSPSSNGILISG